MNRLDQEFRHHHHHHLQQHQGTRQSRNLIAGMKPTPYFPESMYRQYRGGHHYHRLGLLQYLRIHLGRNHLHSNLSNLIYPLDIGLHYRLSNRYRHHCLPNCRDIHPHHNPLPETK